MKNLLSRLLLLVVVLGAALGCPPPATDVGPLPVDAGALDASAPDCGCGADAAPRKFGFTPSTSAVATWMATPSGANLASALTTPLPTSAGGTGVSSLTVPASGLLVGTTDTQTLTGKTIAGGSNTISGISLTSSVSGVLSVANGGTNRSALGTGLQVLRTNAGATDTEWATISGGGASAGATAGQVQTGDGVGGFTAPANVLAGSSFLSIGATPPATGSLRLASASTIFFHANGAGADVPFLSKDTGDNFLFGGTTSVNGSTTFQVPAGAAVSVNQGGTTVFSVGGATSTTRSTLPIASGATPAGSGDIRLTSGFAINVRNIANTGDKNILTHSAGTSITIGDSTAPEVLYLRTGTAAYSRFYTGAAGNFAFTITDGAIWSGFPIIGDSGQPSPFSVHGKTTIATAPPFTVAATDYIYDAIMFTNAGSGVVTFPLPSSDARAYYKTLINTGAGTKNMSNGGAANFGLATNTLVRALFDTAGVHPVSAAVAYP